MLLSCLLPPFRSVIEFFHRSLPNAWCSPPCNLLWLWPWNRSVANCDDAANFDNTTDFGSMFVRSSSIENDSRYRDIVMVPLAFDSENFTPTVPVKSFPLTGCKFCEFQCLLMEFVGGCQVFRNIITYRLLTTDPAAKLETKINRVWRGYRVCKARTKRHRGEWELVLPTSHNPMGRTKFIRKVFHFLPLSWTWAKNFGDAWYLLLNNEATLDNIEQFFDEIRDIKVEEDDVMLASNLTAFCSSTVLKPAEKILGKLQKRHPENHLKTSTIFQPTDLCLCTYFKFDGDICQQIKGTAMGSSISEPFWGSCDAISWKYCTIRYTTKDLDPMCWGHFWPISEESRK